MAEEVMSPSEQTTSQYPHLEDYLRYSQKLWKKYLQEQLPFGLFRRLPTLYHAFFRMDAVIPSAFEALRSGDKKPAYQLARDEATALIASFKKRTITAGDFPNSREKAMRVCRAISEVDPEEGEKFSERFRSVGVYPL